MGFRPEKMNIAKIRIKKELGRQFLNEISNKFELEIIDLVKTAQFEPLSLTDVETKTIDLHAEFIQITEILDSMGSKYSGSMNFEDLSLSDLNDKAQFLLKTTQPFIKQLKSMKSLEEEISEFKKTISSLKTIKDIDIQNIQDIGEGSHFFAVLGFLKGIHQYRLEMALDQLTGGDFIFIPSPSKKAKVICLVGVMKSYQAALNRLLSGLGFEEVKFPKELKGTPTEAIEQAQAELTKRNQELETLRQDVKELVEEHELAIRAIEEQLSLEENRLKILQRTQLRKQNYIIWAWLPAKASKRFLKKIQQIDTSITAEIIKPKLESSEFPTKVSNNIYSRSFENLIHGFGTPGYNEWDPTKFLSIMIPIFFGIMFGDFIDGLVVLLIGLYGLSLNPKKYSKNSMLAELQSYFDKGGIILVTMGLTSMIFGLLFGSYRGLAGDHLIHTDLILTDVHLQPLWFSPEMEGGQFALLELAIVLGAVTIGAALVFQFIQVWSHDKMEAIFLPGMFLLFYIGLLFLLFAFGPDPMRWLSETTGKVDLLAIQEKTAESLIGESLNLQNIVSWGIPVFQIGPFSYPLALLIGSLLLTTGYHFKHGMDGISEWLDYLITLISNTISFARIFAYNIIHSSLSLVFIQLFSSGGHTILDVLPGMILGGFIVIPLELLVSFLQSLRLCWVEFFGKLHYQGSGHLFKPFTEDRLFTRTGD